MTSPPKTEKTRVWLIALVAVAGLCLAAMVLLGPRVLTDRGMPEARRLDAEGDYQAAAAIYQQRLAEAPADATALKGLAVDLVLLRRFDEALPLQEKAVRSDPTDAQLRVELALNYIGHQGTPEKAVDVMREAVAIDSSPRNRAILAQALMEADDLSEAEQELRSVMAKHPTYAYSYSMLYQLLVESGRRDEAAALLATAEAQGIRLGEDESPKGGTT